MKKILRVFPYRTSFTPDDSMVIVGKPPLEGLIPPHDEVHISCVFSWDKKLCLDLQFQWQGATDKPVLVGGPAFNSPVTDFTQGMYVKSEVIFTSRGCNNNCPWCGVPRLEGRIKELPICSGRIIQDNNFLQTSRDHKRKVFEMLKGQRGICFKGGLQADLITDEIADEFAGLRLAEIWLACDTDAALPRFLKAMEKLNRKGLGRNGKTKDGYVKCYVLIGDDMDKNEARCLEVYNAGAMPFAQLYQPIGAETKKKYSEDWRSFARMWQRPAAIKAHCENGTSYHDYNT